MIDFHSEETHLLLNPRLPDTDRQQFEQLYAAAPALDAHVWIATSGTSGGWKLTALSKAALRTSAESVNRYLHASSSDVWASVLPTFHVGGLGIHARAQLSGSRVVSLQWSAAAFVDACSAEHVTLSALVPAQVRDFVQAGLRAPASVRAIVIGGGALSPTIYAEARALGWPILPSYGMTECCSQIATASLSSLTVPSYPPLEVLPHLEVRAEADGRLAFRGGSLLTGSMQFDDGGQPRFSDPKVNGWFASADQGRVDDLDGRQILTIDGRLDDAIKIGGELVSLRRLDAILEALMHESRASFDAALFAAFDDRLGRVIHLAATGDAGALAETFNERVLPFERIRAVRVIQAIPRTALGKLQRGKLTDQLDGDRGESTER